ncbi:EamA family transporter [Celerinatantimonas diazotrophica]|uniref:O-acetylserine/cysteine efflux transporter n=1 Tax=Celerinatantimonas diazotrophica TaxID=412034 RepID=A0A4R1J7N8_9GAMM|nr:EamA family transporter [Celerinatantimonas diazotrophica]TCK46549.1 O-acetylserine/cysteine efflux transporter [Celerinatantimonas diazotrophica]CAG9296599.1 putative amino-acid metabolite efflux pump [Celerinatantimonas diazotrophica]
MQKRDLFLTLLVMAIWGFNFSMIKLGVSEIDPLVIAAARFFFAAVPMVFFIRKPAVKWRYLVLYGIVFGVGVWGTGLSSIAFGLSSGMASVLQQTDVLTSVAVGVLVYKEVISFRMALAIGLSLVGLVISITATNGNVTFMGVIWMLISVICWPLSSVVVRKYAGESVFAFNLWGMLCAPIPLLLLAVALDGVNVITQSFALWNVHAWLSVLFQAYPTTLFGYWIWNKMVVKYPLNLMAPFTLLVSIFALISGQLMFGERLSLIQWVSCSIFLVGIALVIIPGKGKKSQLRQQQELT